LLLSRFRDRFTHLSKMATSLRGSLALTRTVFSFSSGFIPALIAEAVRQHSIFDLPSCESPRQGVPLSLLLLPPVESKLWKSQSCSLSSLRQTSFAYFVIFFCAPFVAGLTLRSQGDTLFLQFFLSTTIARSNLEGSFVGLPSSRALPGRGQSDFSLFPPFSFRRPVSRLV